MSKVFGLTGGIASGKSTVSGIFSENGVPIVDADKIARVIVEPGSEGLAYIVKEFGAEFLEPDGTLNRPKLGAMVFTQPDKMMRLDAILGPLLLAVCGERMRVLQEEGHPLICFDAALLVEKNLHERFRPLVVVSTTRDLQLERLMNRDGFTMAEAEARLKSQSSLEAKVKLADHVIENNTGYVGLRTRTLLVLRQLKKDLK